MKTYLLDIIPKIKRYSRELDDTTVLKNKHWVVVNEGLKEKTVFIFREKENQLLISTNGKIEKGKWEYLGQNSILIDKSDGSYLFKHGFADDTILALKVDGQEKYAILVNEEQFDENEINNIKRVIEFLKKRYFGLLKESNISKQKEIVDFQSPSAKTEKENLTSTENSSYSITSIVPDIESKYKLHRNGNYWGYLDESGSIVIQHKFEDAFPFSEGLACIKLNGKKGFIDKTGTIVIECIYDTTTFFKNERSEVSIGDERFFIDKKGKRI